jgi:hypothetical protein
MVPNYECGLPFDMSTIRKRRIQELFDFRCALGVDADLNSERGVFAHDVWLSSFKSVIEGKILPLRLGLKVQRRSLHLKTYEFL